MLAALAVASVIAFAVPIRRVPAHGEGTTPASSADGPAETAGGTLAAAGGAVSTQSPHSGPISFTIHGDGLSLRHSTSESTVGQALVSAGIRVGRNDLVRPGLDARLTQGMHVYITHSKMVRLVFEGEERMVYTRAENVESLLLEVGLVPQPGDRVFPAMSDPVRKGMTVSIVTFRDGVEWTEEPIGYQTLYENDPNMLQGQQRLVTAGIEGYVRREYRVTRLNGVVLGREMVNETWVAPTGEVVAVGTRAPSTPAPVAAAGAVSLDGLSCVGTMNVYATWYTAASAGGGGVTATGTGVYKGIVAVDPSVIPLGTRMWIPGYGYGLAADTGGAIKGNIIDLGFGPDDLKDWRPKYTDICILG